MNWHGMWRHIDGLVHVIGSHLRMGGHCSVFADCGVEICGLLEDAKADRQSFVGPNTYTKIPTCLRCWYSSNFGTYQARS